MLTEQLVIALPEAGEGKVLTAPYSASGVSLCCDVLCCVTVLGDGLWCVLVLSFLNSEST